MRLFLRASAFLGILVIAALGQSESQPTTPTKPELDEAVAAELESARSVLRTDVSRATKALLADAAALERRIRETAGIGAQEKIRRADRLVESMAMLLSERPLTGPEDAAVRPVAASFQRQMAAARANCAKCFDAAADRAAKDDLDDARIVVAMKERALTADVATFLGDAQREPSTFPEKRSEALEGAILEEIEAATKAHDAEVGASKAALLSEFSAAKARIQENAKLSTADKLKRDSELAAARAAFVADGRLPSIDDLKPAVVALERRAKAARNSCERCFDVVADRSATTSLETARLVLKRKQEFLGAALPVNPDTAKQGGAKAPIVDSKTPEEKTRFLIANVAVTIDDLADKAPRFFGKGLGSKTGIVRDMDLAKDAASRVIAKDGKINRNALRDLVGHIDSIIDTATRNVEAGAANGNFKTAKDVFEAMRQRLEADPRLNVGTRPK